MSHLLLNPFSTKSLQSHSFEQIYYVPVESSDSQDLSAGGLKALHSQVCRIKSGRKQTLILLKYGCNFIRNVDVQHQTLNFPMSESPTGSSTYQTHRPESLVKAFC